MKRNMLATLAALTALPAAVIVSAALGASASTAPATAATTSRLADTGDSGNLGAFGSALDCHTVSVGGINPNPGQPASIAVTGGGSTSTVQSTSRDFGQRFSGMAPSTTYTVTMTAGSDQYTFSVTTPAC